MAALTRDWYAAYVAWYNRFSALIFGFVAAALLLCGVLTWQATVANGRQDRERDEARNQALACIDDRDTYEAKQSAFLRQKTQERDDAIQAKSESVKQFARATSDWSALIITGLSNKQQSTPESRTVFVDATIKMQTTSNAVEQRADELAAASEALRAARAANPVVPPASELCRTGEFVPPRPTRGTPATKPPTLTGSPTPTPNVKPNAEPTATPTPTKQPDAKVTPKPSPKPSPKPTPRTASTPVPPPVPSVLPAPTPTEPMGVIAALLKPVLDPLLELLP